MHEVNVLLDKVWWLKKRPFEFVINGEKNCVSNDTQDQ